VKKKKELVPILADLFTKYRDNNPLQQMQQDQQATSVTDAEI
jgi:hypothetical protein